eukprot:2319722-Pyramimonas_sp.AAC.1
MSYTPRNLANAPLDCLWARPALSLPRVALRETSLMLPLGVPAGCNGCAHWRPLEELAVVVSSDLG